MEYLYILALFGISSALAFDPQNCLGSHVECGPSGGPVWRQLPQLFFEGFSDLDNFDGGIALMAACRSVTVVSLGIFILWHKQFQSHLN
ncbi:hypothetical protein BV898_14974 [Hypsibius exemplaris]|uniref:Uncharacterized protein n=1 Tax=Hypsibius exemplaris TaxID=2072580 RepID=A0A9X6N9K9_HYPEX|nr:hypothetical protein BV898_14974 [Hypsibius exemplaris]